jgi:hypothetical protein
MTGNGLQRLVQSGEPGVKVSRIIWVPRSHRVAARELSSQDRCQAAGLPPCSGRVRLKGYRQAADLDSEAVVQGLARFGRGIERELARAGSPMRRQERSKAN